MQDELGAYIKDEENSIRHSNVAAVDYSLHVKNTASPTFKFSKLFGVNTSKRPII